MKKRLLHLIPTIFFMNISTGIMAQAKLVIDGGVINITNGARLVIDNPDNTAITYNGSGYIQSEGMNNIIIWNIGSGNGNIYLIPFGNVSDYLPVKFNAASGTGTNGSLAFSTYPTPTWKNSDFLPDGVTNVNYNGTDNSINVIDRFWQIKPQAYTNNPDITNLVFSYSDNEYNAPNTITEGNLIAQRWNAVALSWSDYIPVSILNTANNTLTIPSISGNQLFDWWTLVDKTVALPVTLVSFEAISIKDKVQTQWQTSTEINADRFEIYRSRDGVHFDLAGEVPAAGNSNTLLHYKFTDNEPYPGTSYYRLKTVDFDGKYVWSNVVKVFSAKGTLIELYPNPAHDYLVLKVASDLAAKEPLAFLYDTKGSLVFSFKITSISQQIDISRLPQGNYQLVFRTNNFTHHLSFIKK